jgi:hypothetical protein
MIAVAKETRSHQAVIGPAVTKMMMKEMKLLCVPPPTLHSRLSGSGEPWLTPFLTSETPHLLIFPLCSMGFDMLKFCMMF